MPRHRGPGVLQRNRIIIVRVRDGDDMNRLLIFIGMTIFGWVGWWIGAKVGFWTAFMLSGIGSIVGVYVGWRINRDYLS